MKLIFGKIFGTDANVNITLIRSKRTTVVNARGNEYESKDMAALNVHGKTTMMRFDNCPNEKKQVESRLRPAELLLNLQVYTISSLVKFQLELRPVVRF